MDEFEAWQPSAWLTSVLEEKSAMTLAPQLQMLTWAARVV
jgi:hypothetical protein